MIFRKIFVKKNAWLPDAEVVLRRKLSSAEIALIMAKIFALDVQNFMNKKILVFAPVKCLADLFNI